MTRVVTIRRTIKYTMKVPLDDGYPGMTREDIICEEDERSLQFLLEELSDAIEDGQEADIKVITEVSMVGL